MASTGPLGDAPTVIGDLDQVQDLRPPPSAHIIDRLLSLRRNPKQGHFAALSKNEAQNIGGPVRNYGLHGRSEDIGQAYRSEKEAGIKSNYCFLCFRKGTKDYTIKVFFAWPIRNAVKVEETRLKSSATRPRGSTEGGEAVESRGLTGQAYTMKPRPNSFLECETSSADEGSQAEVMQAVQDALYQQQGWWKRWLWGYGIRSAQEIKFHFDNIAENDLAPICVTTLQATVIRDAAQATIDNAPTSVDYDLGDACWGPPHHTQECLDNQDFGTPCVGDQIFEAESRLHGFRMQHWLKECLQCPSKVSTRRLLEDGLLQRSFVYLAEDVGVSPAHLRQFPSAFKTKKLTDIQSISMPISASQLAASRQVRGVYVTLGWDLSLMLQHLCAGGVWTFFGLATVWLGSIIWAGQTKDWSTAWAFGQVLAASITLLLHHT